MSHDDRDRNFEKALARHLRSSAPLGVEGQSLAGAPLESCPDPEILAAYHDQSLSLEERNFWKEHVVSCIQCQFVLTQLEATDKIKLDALPAKDPLLAGKRPSADKERERDSRFVDSVRRTPSWRWVLLIPAGAIAATLVAVISLRTPKSFHLPPSSSFQVAQDQPAPPLDSSSKPALTAPAESKEKVQPPSSSTGAPAPTISQERDNSANELRRQSRSAQQAPNQLAANASHGPSLSRQKQEQQQISQVLGGAAGAFDQKRADAQAAPTPPSNGKLSAASPPPPPAPASEPSFLDGGALSSSSAAKAPTARAPEHSNVPAPKDKSANADAVSAMSETVEVTAEPRTHAQAKAMLRAAALQNPHVFVAPDGKHLWRVGPAGSLERSKDDGLKWSLQTSGVNVDLLAGSAPSARVAWVVGNSGTILRTTDGGAHWIKLDSPVTNDLAGVRATDAFHASIWFVADPQTGAIKTFETTDGGANWSPVPPK